MFTLSGTKNKDRKNNIGSKSGIVATERRAIFEKVMKAMG
jgi:hypothetical protein